MPTASKDSDAGALVALVCLNVFAAVFIVYTGRYLPETVATHFAPAIAPTAG